jgi:antitoxin (DNA-binding transcriptional repressor) of toxin-antitoxin stability system
MRTAQVSELKERLDEVIEAVKNGETVQIKEGIAPIAQMVPETTDVSPRRPNPDQGALEKHIDDLVRQGRAHRGTATLSEDFFTRQRPKFDEGSVVAQLLRDREEGW